MASKLPSLINSTEACYDWGIIYPNIDASDVINIPSVYQYDNRNDKTFETRVNVSSNQINPERNSFIIQALFSKTDDPENHMCCSDVNCEKCKNNQNPSWVRMIPYYKINIKNVKSVIKQWEENDSFYSIFTDLLKISDYELISSSNVIESRSYTNKDDMNDFIKASQSILPNLMVSIGNQTHIKGYKITLTEQHEITEYRLYIQCKTIFDDAGNVSYKYSGLEIYPNGYNLLSINKGSTFDTRIMCDEPTKTTIRFDNESGTISPNLPKTFYLRAYSNNVYQGFHPDLLEVSVSTRLSSISWIDNLIDKNTINSIVLNEEDSNTYPLYLYGKYSSGYLSVSDEYTEATLSDSTLAELVCTNDYADNVCYNITPLKSGSGSIWFGGLTGGTLVIPPDLKVTIADKSIFKNIVGFKIKAETIVDNKTTTNEYTCFIDSEDPIITPCIHLTPNVDTKLSIFALLKTTNEESQYDSEVDCSSWFTYSIVNDKYVTIDGNILKATKYEGTTKLKFTTGFLVENSINFFKFTEIDIYNYAVAFDYDSHTSISRLAWEDNVIEMNTNESKHITLYGIYNNSSGLDYKINITNLMNIICEPEDVISYENGIIKSSINLGEAKLKVDCTGINIDDDNIEDCIIHVNDIPMQIDLKINNSINPTTFILNKNETIPLKLNVILTYSSGVERDITNECNISFSDNGSLLTMSMDEDGITLTPITTNNGYKTGTSTIAISNIHHLPVAMPQQCKIVIKN